MKKLKQYKCKQKAAGCYGVFTKRSSFQTTCDNINCAIKKVESGKTRKKAQEAKKKKAHDKLRLDALRPYSYWVKKAQTACNRFIRARDKDEPCIMCGKLPQSDDKQYGGTWDACHYISRGSCGTLRYHPCNVHKGCKSCNSPGPYKAQKTVKQFRVNLLEKVGVEIVEYLDSYRDLKPLSVEDIKEIELYYKQRYREV